jgi:hypothetical protein
LSLLGRGRITSQTHQKRDWIILVQRQLDIKGGPAKATSKLKGPGCSIFVHRVGHGRILTVGHDAVNFVSTTKPQIAQRFNVSSGWHASPLASADKQGV